jgi:hypothetical protein
VETFVTTVGAFLAGLVLLLCQSWWRRRRAAARRADLEQGGRATMRARLAMPGRRSRAGHVALGQGHAVWTARLGDRRVGLAGASVLSTAIATDHVSGPADIVLRLRLADGLVVALTLDEHDAAVLTVALPASPAVPPVEPPGAPEVGRRWWAHLLLALSGLGVAYCVSMYVTGYTATVTVVGGDGEGFCDVVWEDPQGAERSGEADCYDEPAGTRFDVRVTGWPDPGDPTTPEMYVIIALLLGLPPALVGGVRLRQLHNRRKAWAAPALPPTFSAPAPSLPPLTEADLLPVPGEQPQALLARLAPYARRQISVDAWEDSRRPSGARSPVRPTAVLSRLLWPVWLIGLVAAAAWPLPAQWYALSTGPTVTAEATSTGALAADSFGPLPELLTVRFQNTAGRTVEADIAVDDRLPEGTEIDVEYALADPSAARLRGNGDAFGQGVALCVTALLVGFLWSGGVGVLAWRRTRAVRAARVLNRRPALGLLTADVTGRPLVLAVDPLVSPVTFVAVPVQLPLPQGTGARFLETSTPALSARGALRAGEVVVLEVDGAGGPLVPAAPAAELPLAVVLDLLDSAGVLTRAGDADGPPPDEVTERLGDLDRSAT